MTEHISPEFLRIIKAETDNMIDRLREQLANAPAYIMLFMENADLTKLTSISNLPPDIMMAALEHITQRATHRMVTDKDEGSTH